MTSLSNIEKKSSFPANLFLLQFSHSQSPITLCNLGVGATFGESVLADLPRDSTVVTKTTCELLRVEQQDFRLIWEVI